MAEENANVNTGTGDVNANANPNPTGNNAGTSGNPPPADTNANNGANSDPLAALMGGEGDPDNKQQAATQDADWRAAMHGNDEKLKGIVQRFGSPKAVAEALLATRQKLSSGEFRKGLGENPTEAEMAEFRKTNGIPDSADKYDDKLADGVVLGEEYKPYIDKFKETALANNLSDKQFKAVMGMYAQNLQDEQQVRGEADDTYRVNNKAALMAEWGKEYGMNLNGATNFLATMPEGFQKAILQGRDGAGNLLAHNPEVIKALDGLARQLNPIASIMPGSGTNAQQAMESELETIQKEMSNKNGDYWKGPQNEQGQTKMQERYIQILQAKQRAGS